MDAIEILNPWQREFPLVREPFVPVAAQLGLSVPDTLGRFRELMRNGALSRIGGVFAANVGGASILSALAVPPGRLEAVADRVSAHPGVNHNYQREHAYNLWFVMTGRDAEAVERGLRDIESSTGLRALRLAMQRPYRIDLGFDLCAPPRGERTRCSVTRRAPPVSAELSGLAACVEAGLPLVERPFDAWGESLGCPASAVLAALQAWLDSGTLRRFGAIVRHHELGIDANAMTVFDVPDDAIDACGEALAMQPGVTLAYRRTRDAGWPYNLYCMVHGRDRASVIALIDAATAASGLSGVPREVLFSCRRFKQTGARRFRPLTDLPEVHHAVA